MSRKTPPAPAVPLSSGPSTSPIAGRQWSSGVIALLREWACMPCGAKVCRGVFPSSRARWLPTAFFFPRWWMTDQETRSTSSLRPRCLGPETQPLFELARDFGIRFYLGYAELTEEDGANARRFTSILVAPDGRDRRPLSQDPPARPFRAPAERAVPASRKSAISMSATRGLGVADTHRFRRRHGICNDRRWPETYPRDGACREVEDRRARLQHPDREHPHHSRAPSTSRMFHHILSLALIERLPERDLGARRSQMRRRGRVWHDRRLAIVAPTGEIAAQALTENDELIGFTLDPRTRRLLLKRIGLRAFRKSTGRVGRTITLPHGLITSRTGAKIDV